MKPRPEYVPNNMSDKVRNAVKIRAGELWDEFHDIGELANHLMVGYIFGEYATNSHYNIDDFVEICEQVAFEKMPAVDEPEIEV